jgi:hypothetical protein
MVTINLRSNFAAMLTQAEETRDATVKLYRFMCITDLDEGGMSVTNDIENVLAVLVAEGALTPGMRVIYRDSEDLWDEVIIDEHCKFVTFRALREGVRDAAMMKVIDMMRGRLDG